MISLSKLVLNWYIQNKGIKIPSIFEGAVKQTISIHSIINANAGLKDKHIDASNTLSLLRLQLKRMTCTECLTQATATKHHQITIARLNRRHIKSIVRNGK